GLRAGVHSGWYICPDARLLLLPLPLHSQVSLTAAWFRVSPPSRRTACPFLPPVPRSEPEILPGKVLTDNGKFRYPTGEQNRFVGGKSVFLSADGGALLVRDPALRRQLYAIQTVTGAVSSISRNVLPKNPGNFT